VSTVDSQADLPLMCRMERPRTVDQEVVVSISDQSALVRKAIELSRFKFLEKTYAGYLGLSASQFSKIKNGRDRAGKIWNLPITKIAGFQCLVGHTLLTQWIAHQEEMLYSDDLRELHEAEMKAAALRAKILGRAA
jgi:transcriptional regulator with XRE-family HTH domain